MRQALTTYVYIWKESCLTRSLSGELALSSYPPPLRQICEVLSFLAPISKLPLPRFWTFVNIFRFPHLHGQQIVWTFSTTPQIRKRLPICPNFQNLGCGVARLMFFLDAWLKKINMPAIDLKIKFANFIVSCLHTS